MNVYTHTYCAPACLIRFSALILILTAWLPSACTRFLPPPIESDLVAEAQVAELKRTNAELTRFMIVGKMTLSGPDRPVQAFRAAMAGQLPDRLRIDMFAPYGGSAGTVSSDGEYLYLVRHPTREYHKKRLGSGSLQRLIQINITVNDLLVFLVGRIPMVAEYSARLTPTGPGGANGKADQESEETAGSDLVLIDRMGRIRQRITLDTRMRPVRSVWLNSSQDPAYTLTFSGHQVIEGFTLPRRIDLYAHSGARVSMMLDRYEANVPLDENLFSPAGPSS